MGTNGKLPGDESLLGRCRARVSDLFTEAGRDDGRVPRFGFSDSHGCQREAVFRFRDFMQTWKSPAAYKPLRWVLAAACGTAIGNVLEAAARRQGDVTQESCVLPNAHGLHIYGSLDWLWVDGGVVFDFKCVSRKQFRWIKKQGEPKEGHRAQINGYSVAKNVPHWCLVYIDMGALGFADADTPETQLFAGDANRELADAEVVGFWLGVDGHLKAGTTPEIPGDYTADGFPCGWCSQKRRCWSEDGASISS